MKNIQRKSIELIEELCSPLGISASKTNDGNYQAVFARDAIMAGLAGILADNTIIKKGLVNSLLTLKRTQKEQGQIASNVGLDSSGNDRVSYGTLSHKTDSCCFYLIGVGLAAKHGLINLTDWQDSVYKTMGLLDALEYNSRDLVYVPQGGNWADEYPYHGYLLFDQALRLWGLKLMADLFKDDNLKKKSERIEASILSNYAPKENASNVYHKVAFSKALSLPKDYFLTGFSPAGYRFEFDLAANAIASYIIRDEKSKESLHWVSEQEMPVSAFWPIIKPGDEEWPSISKFFLYEFKNAPGHYHNGGIWWIWLGWLRQSYLINGFEKEAEDLKRWAVDFLENQDNFCFDEYLDRDQLKPSGTKFLAYSATGILLLTSDTYFDPFK
ncbi:hypothetical protein [Arcticibacterium luteifluviistationis]|uniref:Glycoside hydrolase n=1 Tax=Arcticibacterium luteifluviistationis TaxID=1784714 RepID=A0A2Z4GFK8_9BACT|nr:hypothetical protein [Arcticibacterium luteifluviistationis]AWV99951.1 hypothetical protein DJ013_17955 [Arcticibacterium luteifluviistationis]